MSNLIKRLLFKFKMKSKYNQCHKIAFLIAKMGNANVGQVYLDNAKDNLYKAAIIFKDKRKNTEL